MQPRTAGRGLLQAVRGKTSEVVVADSALNILAESWKFLAQSAIFMLCGFGVAGLLKAYLPDDFVARHLGKGRILGVVKASALGMPLPLCSCGVVPAAAALRRQGASKGATTAFLISTPETGVDSIAVTYGLLDPAMALLRPLSAFLTATCAGLLVDGLGRRSADAAPARAGAASCCACEPGACLKPLRHKLYAGMGYAFNDLLGDIGAWFLAGVLIAGSISAMVPQAFIAQHLGPGILPMLIMLLAGIPMYVCATGATPIAAALALKGLSPGAALVFLLSGPATNAASLTMIYRILGTRATALYLASIAGCTLAMGLLTNYVYSLLGIGISGWAHQAAGSLPGLPSQLFGLMLLCLFLRALYHKIILKKVPCDCRADDGHCHDDH